MPYKKVDRLCKRLLVLAVTLVCMSLVAFAQQKDTLYLYNGQVLIGEIKGGQLGELVIDDVDMRKLEIKMYKIRRMNAYRRFKVENRDKIFYYGVIQPSEKDGWVNILQDDGQILHIPITDINVILALEKKFFSRLNGNFSAGLTYTKSNSLGQVNLGSNVHYIGELFENFLSLSAIWSIDSSEFSRDREDGSIFSAYSIGPAWFLCLNLNYQRNLELSVARRFQELIGGGNKIFLRKNWQLMALSGLAFNHEKSTSDISSGLLLEVPITFRFNFFQYRDPNLQVNASQSVYFSLSQKDRVRSDGNISFSWELVRNFYLTLNPYTNYDSHPPQGDSNFDFGLAVSISYKF